MLPITEIDTTRASAFNDRECVIAWTINGHITFALDTVGGTWGPFDGAWVHASTDAATEALFRCKDRSADRFGGQCLPLTRHDLAELVAYHARLDEIVAAAPVSPPTVAEVHALVAEVREHRAARTLTDEERDAVAVLRSFVPLDPSSAARQRCITLIDRITEETNP